MTYIEITGVEAGENVRKFDAGFHTSESFREQIATLTLVHTEGRSITLLREFYQVCQPGLASFDDVNPGADTFRSWDKMDSLIEDRGVRGFFHTHPPLCCDWSSKDIRSQTGFAKANGSKYLWHGVQAASQGDTIVHGSEFVCTWMDHGRVFRYKYGFIEDYLDDSLIFLELPPPIQWLDGAYVIDPQA